MEYEINIRLKGESSFWLFTRSDPNVEFDKYTTILKIFKEDRSQKSFLSMSTFVHDNRGNKLLKTFIKHQLINYNKEKKSNVDEDYLDYKIYIVDSGEDCIIARIFGKKLK